MSEVSKANLFQVDPTSQYSGLLVAAWLDPVLAEVIALPGGESADQLHITLCYCGDAAAMSDVQIAGAISCVNEIAQMVAPPTGQLNGLLRFNASSTSDGLDVFAAQVDIPNLEELRDMLEDGLEECGCMTSDAHGFTPHVTLAYVDPGASLPLQRLETYPLTLSALSVSVGDRRVDIPLTGSMTADEAEDMGEMGSMKAGRRHSGGDMKMLQTMHDNAVSLGASCPTKAIKPMSNALKAISQTDSELRVANYMVLFGGRDLEGIATPRRNQDGSRGEYFSKATQFDSSYTDVGTLYVDWEHGAAPADEPGPHDVLGYVDWKTARIDDKGLFVERVLNRRNKYVQYIEDLIGDGLIGNSTEAVGEGVQKASNGEIKVWPLYRDTLTVQPMEPRMLTANSLAALKALSAGYPALKSIVAQAEMFSLPEATPKATRKIAAVAERDALLLELDLLALEMTP